MKYEMLGGLERVSHSNKFMVLVKEENYAGVDSSVEK